MKHCDLCGVEVDTNKNICPLCYNQLVEISKKQTPELYATDTEKQQKKSKILLAKIFFALSLIVVCVTGYINYATKTKPWSVVVLVGILYLWVTIAHTIISRSTPFKKIFLQIASLSVLLFTTNQIFSSNDWLVCYVYPALACTTGLILAFIVAVSKKRKTYIYSFCSIDFVLGLVSAILLLLKLDSFKLINQINIIFLALCIAMYLIFAGKIIKTEFVRKFHI